jgi:hypothetical protein
MHAKEKSTVTIFPRHNPDVMGLQSKKSHMKVDCTSPDVCVASPFASLDSPLTLLLCTNSFTTFEELSSEWSLG